VGQGEYEVNGEGRYVNVMRVKMKIKGAIPLPVSEFLIFLAAHLGMTLSWK
jgi:hypothetical protein